MVPAMQSLVAKPPGPVSEDEHKQEEKDSSHLEEDDASHSAERPEESAYASRHVSRGLADGAPGRPRTHGSRRSSNGWRLPDAWANAAGRGRLCAPREPLAGHATDYAHPDSQHPADGLRFHTRFCYPTNEDQFVGTQLSWYQRRWAPGSASNLLNAVAVTPL